MNKIKSFDSATSKSLATEIESVLQPLAEKYGIQITRGRGSFTGSNLSLKLELSTIGENGAVKTREYDDLVRMLPMLNLGICAADLNKAFYHEGIEACTGPNAGKQFVLRRTGVETLLKGVR